MGAKVGILALQGDVVEHARVLAELGADPVAVRQPEDLAGVDGLVLPGGESTTMSLLLESSGLGDALAARLEEGMPAFGTCAGMILLGSEVLGGRSDQRCFGAVDITVQRNAFGRQVQSFETDLEIDGVDGGPVRAVFIRAPLVSRVGPGVDVLAQVSGARVEPAGGTGSGARMEPGGLTPGAGGPVVCRQGAVLVAAFHPELSGDLRLHELFLSTV